MKNLLVIGASSDIAKATAKEFARNGFSLTLLAREIDSLEGFKKDIEIRYEVEVRLYQFDLNNFLEFDSFYNQLEIKPDVVLYGAGFMAKQEDSQNSKELTIESININFTAPAVILNTVANDFEKRGSGTIIGISSVAGDRGRKANYIYGSSKAGFSAYLSGLRNRLFEKNIQVITVKPGFVDTKMTKDLDLPKNLTASVEEVADDIFKAYKNKKDVIYTKPKWFFIMLIIKHIPEFIFKRLSI